MTQKVGMTQRVLVLAFVAFTLASGLMAVEQVVPAIPRAIAAEEGDTAKPGPAIAKIGAWMLGDKLSFSAIMYFRGGDKSVLPEAQEIAGKLGLKAPQFPAEGRKQGDPGLIKVVEYFGKGAGADVAKELRGAYSDEHGTLYELAVQMIMLWDFYRFDPTMTDPLAKGVRSRAILIALPDQVWRPTLDLVAKRATYEQVKAAVMKADDDALAYLREKARAGGR
jgi:hypothetical protein